jgi:hypothetical protein
MLVWSAHKAQPGVGNMSSTHSANPLACVGGLTTLQEIRLLDLVSEAGRKGEILHRALDELRELITGRQVSFGEETSDRVFRELQSKFRYRVLQHKLSRYPLGARLA